MKLGYSTWGMPKVPIDIIVPHLAKLGFDGVELTVKPGWSTELYAMDRAERRRIRQLLTDHGLELPSIAGHTSLLARDTEEHAANFQRLKDTIDLAVEWAMDGIAPILDTTTGGKPEEWDELKPLLVERTAALVEYAETRGVVIGMEPHYANLINTPERVLELLRLVDSPNLRVTFDISHFNIQGYSIEQSVAAMAPVAVFAHIKDERGLVPDFDFLIPGEGVFDYVTYLKEMARHGYTGYIMPEISIFVQARPDYDALAAATQSAEVLNHAYAAAGMPRRVAHQVSR